GEHGVHVGIPEGEPGAERLSDIHHEGGHGAAIADQADDDGAVDDGLEPFELHDVEQEAGKEGAGAEGDDREVDEDPQAEGVAVIHVGLVQAFDEAQTGAIRAEKEQGHPGGEPQEEARGGAAPDTAGDELFINLVSHGRTPFQGVGPWRFRAPSSSWTGNRFWDRWRAIPAYGSCPEGGRRERFRWPGR